MSKTKAASKGSKLTKIMKSPIRALVKVRDFYIRSMTECSGHFDYGAVMGFPAEQVTALPTSFSVGSGSTRSSNGAGDSRELVKAASTKSNLGNRIEFDFAKQQIGRRQLPVTASPSKFLRSLSVGIGRIDEDMPCEFEEDVKVRIDVYPKSRSYALPNRKMY